MHHSTTAYITNCILASGWTTTWNNINYKLQQYNPQQDIPPSSHSRVLQIQGDHHLTTSIIVCRLQTEHETIPGGVSLIMWSHHVTSRHTNNIWFHVCLSILPPECLRKHQDHLLVSFDVWLAIYRLYNSFYMNHSHSQVPLDLTDPLLTVLGNNHH